MPAVQAKIIFDTKNQADEDNVKVRGRLKTRVKERNCSRKSETPLERSGQMKKKKNIVPELDLKTASPKSQNKRNQSKDKSTCRTKNEAAAITAAARLAKKRQWKIGNDYSKFNMLQEAHKTERAARTTTIKEPKDLSTFRSVYNTTRREEPFKAEIENINPNQLPDNYFECDELDEFFRNPFPDFDSSSEYGYHTPQLYEEFCMPPVVSARCGNHNGSPGVLRHFKELLHQEESSRTNLLAPGEVALLKEIVKADERHQKLRRDDYDLLKEILLGQLKEISQQERVIKIALKKIRSYDGDEPEVSTIKIETAEQPMEDSFRSPKSKKSTSPRSNSARIRTTGTKLVKINSAQTHREEVDVIFKNVPSLEKEIRILRTLGLKLEETLKKTTRRTEIFQTKPPMILHTVQKRYFRHCLCIASSIVFVTGRKVFKNIAQEYQIRHQTINELKLEREFFIPSDLLDRFTLQRTNFHKLSRNPSLLLRRLKPFTKNSRLKFNFIEQDPMFFNNFLTKMCSICTDPADCHDTFIPFNSDGTRQQSKQKIIFVKSGAGDHPDFLFNHENQDNSSTLKLPIKAPTLPNNSLHKKKKKKRCITPLPENRELMPKNKFLKTILMGTLQLTIIVTILTAILYPDILCL